MKTALKLLLLTLMLPLTAQAQVRVNVSGAGVAAQPIAVLPIQGDPGVKMDYIIASDLHKTGLFQPIDPKILPERPNTPGEIHYPAWQQAGIDYIVLGRMQSPNAGQFVLSDTASASVLSNEHLADRNARRLAHQIADRIIGRLTGKRGAFATSLAYVLEQGNGDNRRYSLLVSDVDGANRHEIFSSQEPIMSPAWAPNGKALAYVAYNNNHVQIVIQDLNSGSRRVVAQGRGMSNAPAFSPDGKTLAFVQSENGNPDIYTLDLMSGRKTRLTRHAAIDTEPVFSPDGRFIYFTSDRAGNPQIYRMNSNGGSAERVVIGSGYSAGGDLSPDGRSLVLTRQTGGSYQIGLYDLNSNHFKKLTGGKLDEGASFAPNGQLIIYATKEGGHSILKVINSKGGVAQTLSDPKGRLRDPAWGPDVRP